MFNITEERMSSYNADRKTVPALVARDDYGKVVAVARFRKFESREDWERRVTADAIRNAA